MLIVEDDADFASVVAEVGQNHGFTSLICSTGEQGLEALRREHFAAVILDILLPDISGWQVHRELRADERHRACRGNHHLLRAAAARLARRRFALSGQTRGTGRAGAHFHRAGPPQHNPLRLLLVETDPRRRMLIRDYFERLGNSVTLAATAEAARLAYAEQTFPVVVVDHEMSDDSGLDLLDALERLRSLRGVTVLLNSRQPLSDEMQRLRRYSAMTLSRRKMWNAWEH